MNSEEYGKEIKKTINPGKCREVLVGSEFLSDVTFILGDQQEELAAHAFFLATASPVFHEIFTSQSDDDAPLAIKISDISKATMTEICRFAYCEKVRLNQHNMFDILAAATKFKMIFLADKATNYIVKEGLNENTIFNVFEANQKDKNMIINMKCFAYIEANHQKCFKSNDFVHLSSDLLRMILQGCKLPAKVAQQAIALWSAHPDNVADDLEDLVALITLDDDTAPSKATTNSGETSQPVEAKTKAKKPKNKNSATANVQPVLQTPMHSLFVRGDYEVKNFQTAVLALKTTKPLFIIEFMLLIDRSVNEQDFVIAIHDAALNNNLLWTSVCKNDKKVHDVGCYTLPSPCELAAGREIIIIITFATTSYRKSLDSQTLSSNNSFTQPGGLELGSSNVATTLGQVISRIGYKFKD